MAVFLFCIIGMGFKSSAVGIHICKQDVNLANCYMMLHDVTYIGKNNNMVLTFF